VRDDHGVRYATTSSEMIVTSGSRIK
jgi:hypothetical protein